MTPEQELETALMAVLKAIAEQNPVIRQGSFDLPFKNIVAVKLAVQLMEMRSAERG
jgi:hypothetical protein